MGKKVDTKPVTKKPAEPTGQPRETDIAFSKKPLESAVVEKRPSKTFTEILSEPKEQPANAPDPKHPYPDDIVVKPKPIDEATGVIVDFKKVEHRKLESKVDFIRMPLGMLDFENAGILFKDVTAPNNKKLVGEFDRLLTAGYSATLRVVDNNYAYFQFEKE